jgi:GDP-L-fucose synthase
MKVLITGGCGFLGRHFAKALLKQGHHVIVIDNLSNGVRPQSWPKFLRPERKDKFEFFHADVRDFFDYHLRGLGRKGGFDLVIHLAATVGGRSIIEGSPIENAATIAIDAEFFRWLAFEQPKYTIYMSSPAIYPVDLQDEDNDWRLDEIDLDIKDTKVLGIPDLVYGWSKLTAEYLAYVSSEKHGLNIFCPRPFSGYGEDQSLDYPMPSICKRVADKEDPLIVWGSGKQNRDWVHVDDIVECVLKTYPKFRGYNTLNIGTGIATNFFQLAELASKIEGYSPKIEPKTDAPEGVINRVADISKLNVYYKPKINLKEGVTRVIKYLKENDKHSNNLSK